VHKIIFYYYTKTAFLPSSCAQAARGYTKGMAVFVQIKGGLMYEAAIGGQKFRFEPL
jgi:hypothetical protein